MYVAPYAWACSGYSSTVSCWAPHGRTSPRAEGDRPVAYGSTACLRPIAFGLCLWPGAFGRYVRLLGKACRLLRPVALRASQSEVRTVYGTSPGLGPLDKARRSALCLWRACPETYWDAGYDDGYRLPESLSRPRRRLTRPANTSRTLTRVLLLEVVSRCTALSGCSHVLHHSGCHAPGVVDRLASKPI